jgi:hypothetical protein
MDTDTDVGLDVDVDVDLVMDVDVDVDLVMDLDMDTDMVLDMEKDLDIDMDMVIDMSIFRGRICIGHCIAPIFFPIGFKCRYRISDISDVIFNVGACSQPYYRAQE